MPVLTLLLSATDPLAALREGGLDLTLAQRATGLLGLAAILGLAWLLSYDRRRVPWRLVGMGLLLQASFGLLVLKSTPGRWFFERVGAVVNAADASSLYEVPLVLHDEGLDSEVCELLRVDADDHPVRGSGALPEGTRMSQGDGGPPPHGVCAEVAGYGRMP